MLHHRVSTVAQNRHAKHRLLGGPVMIFCIFFAFLAATAGDGVTRGVHFESRCH